MLANTAENPSVNISKRQRDDRLEKIDAIESYLREHDADMELLKGLNDIRREIKNKRFGLVFEQHKEYEEERLELNLPVLAEKTELCIDNGAAPNFLIEGDNLASLTLLSKTHKGRIDVIYIDPPYNTGNKDFIYNDKLMNKEDGYRHSKWLSFMACRLKIARELLSKHGVIFISIDDNEQAALKLLCDEVFGEENFYGQFIQKKGNTQNDSNSIQRNHEYILCYVRAQQKKLLTYNSEVKHKVYENSYYYGRDTGASSGHDKLSDRANLGYTVYYIESTANGATGNHNKLSDRANLLNSKYGDFLYYISADGKRFIHAVAVMDYDKSKISDGAKEEDVYNDCHDLTEAGYHIIRPPKRKGGKLGCWTWSIDTFKDYWNKNEIIIKNYKNIIYKKAIDADKITTVNGEKYYIETNCLPLQSIIDLGNAAGTKTLSGPNGILPGCVFSNPKGVEMLKYLIGSYINKSAIVLDFFAGSGTTGQAVMELNYEDGGERRFILCTNNENGICSNITYPRLRTVITGKRKDGSKYSDGLPADLKYYEIKYIKTAGLLHEQYYNDLLKHVREMVELENGVVFGTGPGVGIVLTAAELESLMSDITKLKKIKRLYISHNVLWDKYEKQFEQYGVEVINIPEYYI